VNRILKWVIAAIANFWSFAVTRNSPGRTVTRISVLSGGNVLLDGKEATISEVGRALEMAKTKQGAVWFYRESGRGEPPPVAIEIFKRVVESKLPVSLSTKPDFSDYVDEEGRSHPRK
jgi:hypothetical protein